MAHLHHHILNIHVSQHHIQHVPSASHGHASDLGGKLRKAAKLKCIGQNWRFGLIMAIVVLSIMFVLFLLQKVVLSQKSPSCTNVYFSPHTSVAFDVSGMYCDKLTIKKYSDNSPASHWNTSLYLMNQMPNLSTVYDFTVSESITLSTNEFYKWSFYLHEGSSYRIEACKLKVNGIQSNDVQVCIIGGDKNLNDWIKTHSCEHPHFIKACNGSNLANVTYSEIVNETNTYYFVYSTHTQSLPSKISLQVDMAFTSLEYSLEKNNIYRECTILSDKGQSCAINIPTHFIGAAVLATSALTDQPEVWKDTLPVSWDCSTSNNFLEIHMFLPAAASISLFGFWVLTLRCIATYCGINRSRVQLKIKQATVIAAVIVTLVVIMISLCVNIMGAQELNTALSWSCDPIYAESQLIVYVMLYAGMGFSLLLWLLKVLYYSRVQKQTRSGDQRQNASARHNEQLNDIAKPRAKRIMVITLVIIMGVIMVSILAAFFTFLEAILPILAVYSIPDLEFIFTPGDTWVFTFNNFFISSLPTSYVGSPHLSATLYISDKQPQLSKYTAYGTSETIFCNQSECQHIWQSYLHQKSSVNISVCLNESNGANATFRVIKGMNGDTSDDSQIHISPGSNSINHSVLTESNKCFEWTLYTDDQNVDRYFFILKGQNHSSFNIDLQFNRSEYSPDYTNADRVTNCTINSHSSDSCTLSLQKKVSGSSTAFLVVKSDLNKPLYEWQETICIQMDYNFRADTWTTLWLPVFVVNVIVFSILWILL